MPEVVAITKAGLRADWAEAVTLGLALPGWKRPLYYYYLLCAFNVGNSRATQGGDGSGNQNAEVNVNTWSVRILYCTSCVTKGRSLFC